MNICAPQPATSVQDEEGKRQPPQMDGKKTDDLAEQLLLSCCSHATSLSELANGVTIQSEDHATFAPMHDFTRVRTTI
eukprot:7111042-Ditylum_brightwellii.AAC.1